MSIVDDAGSSGGCMYVDDDHVRGTRRIDAGQSMHAFGFWSRSATNT